MHRKVTPIKAGKEPCSRGACRPENRPPAPWAQGGRWVGGAANARCKHTERHSCTYPRHPQQLGWRPRRWEQREPWPQVCSETPGAGSPRCPGTSRREASPPVRASPPTPRPVPTKQLPQHPAPHPAPKSPVGWPDGSGEMGTSMENCKQWPSEPETALALHHSIFLSSPPPHLPHTRVQTFGGSGALARRQPTSRTCKAVLVGQGQGIIHRPPNGWYLRAIPFST